MIHAKNHRFEEIRLVHRCAKTFLAQPSDANFLWVLFQTTLPKRTQDSNAFTAFSTR